MVCAKICCKIETGLAGLHAERLAVSYWHAMDITSCNTTTVLAYDCDITRALHSTKFLHLLMIDGHSHRPVHRAQMQHYQELFVGGKNTS